jgi:hypothetical protein
MAYNPQPEFQFSGKSATTEWKDDSANCTVNLKFTLSNYGISANNVTVVARIYGNSNETITNEYIDVGTVKNKNVTVVRKSFVVLKPCDLINNAELSVGNYTPAGIIQAISGS